MVNRRVVMVALALLTLDATDALAQRYRRVQRERANPLNELVLTGFEYVSSSFYDTTISAMGMSAWVNYAPLVAVGPVDVGPLLGVEIGFAKQSRAVPYEDGTTRGHLRYTIGGGMALAPNAETDVAAHVFWEVNEDDLAPGTVHQMTLRLTARRGQLLARVAVPYKLLGDFRRQRASEAMIWRYTGNKTVGLRVQQVTRSNSSDVSRVVTLMIGLVQ